MKTNIDKMKKVDLIAVINKERAETTNLKSKEEYFVHCNWCDEFEKFSTRADAEKWILNDMEDNCHEASYYTVVVGRSLEVEHKPASVSFND